MKPVKHITYDKNGEEQVFFNASPRMILFAIEKSKAPGEADGTLAKRAGIDPSLPCKWASKYGQLYLNWLEEFVDTNVGDRQAEVLEAVGMIQATQLNGYSFWKDMAKKHGVIKDDAKVQNIVINTDFSQILIGDPVEARRRILQETRGLVIPTGLGVAPPPGVGQHQGAGSGTGDLQERPVEIFDALDSDGRRPEQGAPVPVVSKQTTPSGNNRVLGKRKISRRT